MQTLNEKDMTPSQRRNRRRREEARAAATSGQRYVQAEAARLAFYRRPKRERHLFNVLSGAKFELPMGKKDTIRRAAANALRALTMKKLAQGLRRNNFNPLFNKRAIRRQPLRFSYRAPDDNLAKDLKEMAQTLKTDK